METHGGDADAPLAALRSPLALPSPRTLLRSRPLAYELTGVCSSVAVPPCGALEETRVRWSLSSGPNRAPRLRTLAAAPGIPDDRGPVRDS
jgi:hypothetical protein